ncbi:Uncharacterized protein FWK35_00035520, partial [Aphis craccivora]
KVNRPLASGLTKWRCIIKTCKAFVKTFGETTTNIAEQNVDHSHSANSDQNIQRQIVSVSAKRKAIEDNNEKPSKIVCTVIRSIPQSEALQVSDLHNIKLPLTSKVPRTKKSINMMVSDEASLRIKKLKSSYESDTTLNKLQSLRWYMDGNFALAPKLFSQLYVIRVEINKKFTTAVYILLQNKTLATYEMMLTTLLKKCEEQNSYPDPAVVHVDFERAVITAIIHVLGQHIHIQSCFYHLTQSTYQKVQELGLQTQYRENQNLIEFCGKMNGSAFLPIGDKYGIAYLKKIVPEEAESLLNYFDETYVNGKYGQVKNENNKIVLKNCPPTFPPNLWNVNESTLNDEERTNNSTEGWNLRFSKLVGQTHPKIWTIIVVYICMFCALSSREIAKFQGDLVPTNFFALPCN